MTDTISIQIPAEYIAAAMCAVSKEETRYYLKGVFVDARGYVAGTNGHIAFAAKLPEAYKLAEIHPARVGKDGWAGVIIPDTVINAIAKGKDSVVTLERDANGLWWLAKGAMRTHFQPIDGNFPDWLRIVPELPETLVAAHYDPLYVTALGNMAKALRDGMKGEAHLFRIMQSGEDAALVLFPKRRQSTRDTEGARSDCCAVIMPMRGIDVSGFTRDAFAKE